MGRDGAAVTGVRAYLDGDLATADSPPCSVTAAAKTPRHGPSGARLGYWPAALGLFTFVWLELVYPYGGMVSSVRTWCLLYAAVMLLGSAVYGTRWFERADPFEVYFSLVARLSPFGRRAGTGNLVVRNPLENLDGVRVDYGLVGVVAVLLGSPRSTVSAPRRTGCSTRPAPL